MHTSLFRAILKSLNRKVVSEKRLQTYFLKFARLITALCDDTDCLSALHTLNYTQIQFRFLLSRIHEPSVSLPPYIHRVVDMTLEFICLEKELLYHRIEHPRSFISEPAFTSPLHWSKHYPAISVSNPLRTRSDDSTSFRAGRWFDSSIQFGCSGLREYIAC
mgnify:CR=1 FL=1